MGALVSSLTKVVKWARKEYWYVNFSAYRNKEDVDDVDDVERIVDDNENSAIKEEIENTFRRSSVTEEEISQNIERNNIIHHVCRSSDRHLLTKYYRSKELFDRPVVPDDKVKWYVEFQDYEKCRIEYDAPLKQVCDGDNPNLIKKWNNIDGGIDRRSCLGKYQVVNDGNRRVPLNPVGRTGVSGRGVLARWGPNHAVDPVITRWKDDRGEKVIDKLTNKPILQVLSILRKDTNQWALIGNVTAPGEVDKDKDITNRYDMKKIETLRKEILQEKSSIMPVRDIEQAQTLFNKFKNNQVELFRSYVDDPRNTDNAWMETKVILIHDYYGLYSNRKSNALKAEFTIPQGSDNILKVDWLDIDRSMSMFASHRDFVKVAAYVLDAHW